MRDVSVRITIMSCALHELMTSDMAVHLQACHIHLCWTSLLSHYPSQRVDTRLKEHLVLSRRPACARLQWRCGHVPTFHGN